MDQVLCPILVGRDDQLRLLSTALEAVPTGLGGAVFVVGEAGIGKSRLVREAVTLGRGLGLTVLAGRAVDTGTRVPFRPLSEALTSAIRQRGVPQDGDLEAFRGALGRLLPDWRGTAEPTAEGSTVMLGEAILRLLRGLREEVGFLLVLEDLHWADSETLAIVEYLADNAHREPLLVLATARTDEGRAVEQLGRSLQARGCAAFVPLGRLRASEVERMARATLAAPILTEQLIGFVRSWTDGVPLLIEDLLAELVSTGAMVQEEQGWVFTASVGVPVPAGFRHATEQRLTRLETDAQRVVLAAAVLGGRFDLPLLEDLSELSQMALLDHLRAAVDAQLVVIHEDGFRFRHALTKDAILASLLPPERAALAERALHAVYRTHPELPGAWCELAADLAHAAGAPRKTSTLLLESARRALSRGALATAEDTLRRSRELADNRLLIAEVEEMLLEVLASAGKPDDALQLGVELLENLAVLDAPPRRRAEIHLRLARTMVAATRWEPASSHVTEARALADQDDNARLHARIDAVAAAVALGRRDPTQGAALARRALEAARESDLPDVACEALEVLGRCARLHDLKEAQTAFIQAEALAAKHELTLRRIRALHELATIDVLSVNASTRLAEARDLAARAGALATTATLDIQLASVHYGAFEPDHVLDAASRAAATARRLRLDGILPMALLWQAAGHAQRGEQTAMESAIGDALALAADDPDALAMSWGWCRAMCRLVDDAGDQAAAHLDRAAALLRASAAVNPWGFRGLWALLRTVEDRDGVAACTEVAEAGAGVFWMNRGYLALAQAVEEGRRGNTLAAQALFGQGDAALSPSMWFRYHAWRVVSEAAIADRWGDPVVWLREAVVFFEDRGQQRLAAGCRSQLRKAGAPVPRRGRGESTVPGPLRALGVTSRETDVLRLVAERLGNKEIGARLYLSPRTVEKHVASLIEKTAARDRLELVRLAGDHLGPGASGR